MGLRDAGRSASCFVLMVALLAPAVAGQPVRFGLAMDDVREIVEVDGTAWIRLEAGASARLQDLTGASLGRNLHVELEGVPILESRIRTEVDSGVIVVDAPPEGVLGHLRSVRDAMSSGGQ